MYMDNKSEINKMEKLHQILDNPYNVKIKKSDNLEPTVTIHSPEKKPSVSVKQNKETKEKQIKGETFENEDLYEVEKVNYSEPKFLQVTPDEKVIKNQLTSNKVVEFIPISKHNENAIKNQLTSKKVVEFLPISKHNEKKEKIISKQKPNLGRKDGIADFQEIESVNKKLSDLKNKMEETYLDGIKKKKKDKSSLDHIQIYRPIIIFEMWAFTLTIGVAAISGLFLLRDWLFLNFGVYGDKFISTPEGIQDIHIWFGYTFAVLGLFHLAIHIFSKKKDILSKQTLQDFKAFLHSGMYLIGFARREDYRIAGEKFTGRQKIIYISLVYILGLTTITGVFYNLSFLSSKLAMVHIVPAGLSIMVLLFHFLITLRKHDLIALKATFLTGKLPQWYVRKNHPIWYDKIRPEMKSTLSGSLYTPSSLVDKVPNEENRDLFNAVSKFLILFDENPDENTIKFITEELKNTQNSYELQRIIELAKQLEDNVDLDKEETGE